MVTADHVITFLYMCGLLISPEGAEKKESVLELQAWDGQRGGGDRVEVWAMPILCVCCGCASHVTSCDVIGSCITHTKFKKKTFEGRQDLVCCMGTA